MPAQQRCDSFRYRRAAFYNGLKSKVGLAAAKAAALRVNLNIDGCGVESPLILIDLALRSEVQVIDLAHRGSGGG